MYSSILFKVRASQASNMTSITSNTTISNFLTNSKPSMTTQTRTVTAVNRNQVPNDTVGFKKTEPFPSTKLAGSTVDHSGGLSAVKNTIKNTAAESFGTFAAKVAADTKPSTSTESNQIHSSPKHVISNQPPPFSSSNVFMQASNDKTVKTTSAPSYTNVADVAITSNVPTSIANRHDRNSVYREVAIDKPVVALEPTSIIQPNAGLQANAKALPNASKTSSVQLPIIPNSQSHEYSLFLTGEWEKKSTFNGRTAENFLESDTIPKADASKAPGYRGANLNSPVNSKHLKLAKNDEKSAKELEQKIDQSVQKPTESSDQLDTMTGPKRDILKLDTDELPRTDKNVEKESVVSDLDKPQIASHISPIGIAPAKLPPPIGSQLNIATSQSIIKPNTSVYGNTVNDSFSQSIIRPPTMQPLSVAQDMSSSRSLSQTQLRMMVSICLTTTKITDTNFTEMTFK